MNLFYITNCPICKSQLKKMSHTRHDEFFCDSNCYCYLDLFELQEKAVVLRLNDYSLIFRFGQHFKVISIYNFKKNSKLEDKNKDDNKKVD